MLSEVDEDSVLLIDETYCLTGALNGWNFMLWHKSPTIYSFHHTLHYACFAMSILCDFVYTFCFATQLSMDTICPSLESIHYG